MAECTKCGRRDEEVRLFDGIYVNEAIKVCERCSLVEGIPIVKLPNTGQLKESEKGEKVYRRLNRMTGGSNERESRSIYEELKDLREKPELEKPVETPLKLIPNCHWVIKRHRRLKKLSHKHVAEAIHESETALRLIERNTMPEDSISVIRKLEQFFQIQLIEKGPMEKMQEKKESFFPRPKTEVEFIPIKKQEQEEVNVPEIEIIEEPEELSQEGSKEMTTMEDYLNDLKGEEENDIVKKAIATETDPAIIKHEKVNGQPLRVLDFKKEKLDKITVADLKEVQRVIDADFPTKTSEEIGKEQLEDFGKKEVPNVAQKYWFDKYKSKRHDKPDHPGTIVQESGEKVPTISELAEQKGKDGKILGSDIELAD